MKKKKIFLSAYVSANLGDDLFIKIICERYTDTDFYILGSEKYKHVFHNIKNLNYISTDTIFKKILNKFSNVFKINLTSFFHQVEADAHVKIGGSMFMQTHNWQTRYIDNVKTIEQYKKNYILGSNFGPYALDEFVEKHGDYFSKFDDICFRDIYSVNLFKNYSNIRYAEDIVFQLDYPVEKAENYYVISAIYCSNRKNLKDYHTAYITKLAKIIDSLVKTGSKVVLLGFCQSEKDHIANEEVYNKIENKEKVTIYNHDDINTSLDLIANSKGIIATRFHAMILGLVFKKPTVPIIYSEKMRTVLEDIKYNGVYYDLEQIDDIDVNDCVEHLINKVDFDIESFKEGSKKQFLELDKLLLTN